MCKSVLRNRGTYAKQRMLNLVCVCKTRARWSGITMESQWEGPVSAALLFVKESARLVCVQPVYISALRAGLTSTSTSIITEYGKSAHCFTSVWGSRPSQSDCINFNSLGQIRKYVHVFTAKPNPRTDVYTAVILNIYCKQELSETESTTSKPEWQWKVSYNII